MGRQREISLGIPAKQLRADIIECTLRSEQLDCDYAKLIDEIKRVGLWPSDQHAWVSVMEEIAECETLLGLDVAFRERMLDEIEYSRFRYQVDEAFFEDYEPAESELEMC